MKQYVIVVFFVFFYSKMYAQKSVEESTCFSFLNHRQSFRNEQWREDQSVTVEKAAAFHILPAFKIQLAIGDSMGMRELIEEKKYIYISIWSAADGLYMHEVLDSIADKYKNTLLILGLFDKGNLHQLKKIIRKQQIRTKQGLLPIEMKEDLQLTGYPSGMLFSKEGKLIKAGIGKNELNNYLEKYVVERRAKF